MLKDIEAEPFDAEDNAFLRKVILENEDIKRRKERAQIDARKQMARVQQENLEKQKQKEARRLKEQEDEMKLMKVIQNSLL